ncbi:hypothetical protein BN134_1742 [Cronobacter dublinensis 1210]|uniref:Uncharacterized protein n=1 Tax=Cronobacter dublinensis 1210 TaxID=1208656 RepID=A0ABP1W7J8_9ENTR|nr:hypothetical protein BN134_1742 [Cronobacter dublinensis 1210]CCJ85996.1 hypothetical protein BN133_2373 [Cronobacter dublinensis 582]
MREKRVVIILLKTICDSNRLFSAFCWFFIEQNHVLCFRYF